MSSYCTVQQLKETLDIITPEGEDDLITPILERVVEAASDWVDAYCGWGASAFAPGSTERIYSSQAVLGGDLILDTPLVELEEIRNGDGSLISPEEAQLFPLNASRYFRIHLRSKGWSFPEMDSVVTVSGKFGFSLTPPSAIQEATIMLSGWIYKRYQAGLQTNSVSPELGTVLYGSAMPPQVKDILRQYASGKRFL